MPGRWTRVFIVVFWLFMTGWLIRRDVLPRLGWGEMTFRAVLAERAIAEASRWNLYLGERLVGSAVTRLDPQADGSYILVSRASLVGLLPDDREQPPPLLISSEAFVSPLGRLTSFHLEMGIESVESDALKARIHGVVEGQEMVIKSEGLPLVPPVARFPIDPEAIFTQTIDALDRIPGLAVGKEWTTRAINPMAGLLGGGVAPDIIRHRVKQTESIHWDGEDVPCFLIEHIHGSTTARSWARTRDGRVLRQIAPIGGVTIRLELDPVSEKG